MPDMTPDELARVGLRYETTSEHIARDMREGRFPERSDRQVVALTTAPVAPDVAGLIERLEEVWADENNGALCHEAAADLAAILAIPLPGDPLPAALELPEVRALVEAVEKLGLRKLVAGWNGEDRDTPYTPHPSHLRAKINTTCGVVYKIDAALARVKGETA